MGGIPPIRLDPLARLLGNEGRGHDHARHPVLGERAVQAIPTGAGLVGDDHAGAVAVEPSKELLDVGFSGSDLADGDDVGRAVGAGVGDGDTLFMAVETDEKGGRLWLAWLTSVNVR